MHICRRFPVIMKRINVRSAIWIVDDGNLSVPFRVIFVLKTFLLFLYMHFFFELLRSAIVGQWVFIFWRRIMCPFFICKVDRAYYCCQDFLLKIITYLFCFKFINRQFWICREYFQNSNLIFWGGNCLWYWENGHFFVFNFDVAFVIRLRLLYEMMLMVKLNHFGVNKWSNHNSPYIFLWLLLQVCFTLIGITISFLNFAKCLF